MTYDTNWERDLARCADALEQLLALLKDERQQKPAPAKTSRTRDR